MNTKFIIFFSIIFILYFLVNTYIFVRGWQAISTNTTLRAAYTVLFLIFACSFIISMAGEGKLNDKLIGILYPLGSTWLVGMLYFTLFIIFFDLIRLINHFIPFFPKIIIENYAKVKLGLLLTSISTVIILCLFGYYNFSHPIINKLEINIPKKAGKYSNLHIVMVSDIHIGHGIKNNSLKKFVEIINNQNPDIILIAGDIIDRDLNFVIKNNMGAELKKLYAPLGVYGVLGNHEYISGNVQGTIKYLEESGINILRDTIINIQNSFYVIGRDDLSNNNRLSLKVLTDTINMEFPILLLDHQPSHINEAINTKIDLLMAGHTHHGQLFPINYITEAVYKLAYGYKKEKQTNIYVSSGLGLWGPPYRIGTKSEIVDITLHFNE